MFTQQLFAAAALFSSTTTNPTIIISTATGEVNKGLESSIGLINSFSLSSLFEFMQPATNELNGFSREDVNKMGGQAVAAYDKSPAEEVVNSSRKTFSSPACEGFFENITTTTTTTTSSWKGDHHCQVVLAFKGTSTMSELFLTNLAAFRAHPTNFL